MVRDISQHDARAEPERAVLTGLSDRVLVLQDGMLGAELIAALLTNADRMAAGLGAPREAACPAHSGPPLAGTVLAYST